jgi:hypothetical protein
MVGLIVQGSGDAGALDGGVDCGRDTVGEEAQLAVDRDPPMRTKTPFAVERKIVERDEVMVAKLRGLVRRSVLPCALARSSPNITRSRTIARSNSAKIPPSGTAALPTAAALVKLTGQARVNGVRLWITCPTPRCNLTPVLRSGAA